MILFIKFIFFISCTVGDCSGDTNVYGTPSLSFLLILQDSVNVIFFPILNLSSTSTCKIICPGLDLLFNVNLPFEKYLNYLVFL